VTTSWEPRPSSIIAKRPDDSISCRPTRKKAGALAGRLPDGAGQTVLFRSAALQT
jgi:hypothetical protein